jgi:Deoxynucleoside kinases
MYIVISGNIGAGKTSLAQIISEDMGFSVYFEDFHSNLFLKDYYQDMKRWAFATQINFLALRYEQIVHHMLLSKIPAVLDRSIYEDREVFAKSLYEEGLMTKRSGLFTTNFITLWLHTFQRPIFLFTLKKV